MEEDDAASLLVRVALAEGFPAVKYQRVSSVNCALQILLANAEAPSVSLPKLDMLRAVANVRALLGFM